MFRASEAAALLTHAGEALVPGGALVLEPQTFESVRERGRQGPSWYAAERGLFSDEPHVCLHESFWNPERAVAIERWYVIDAASGAVTRHAATTQAYSVEAYRDLLRSAGFGSVDVHPSLEGEERNDGLLAVVARRVEA